MQAQKEAALLQFHDVTWCDGLLANGDFKHHVSQKKLTDKYWVDLPAASEIGHVLHDSSHTVEVQPL